MQKEFDLENKCDLETNTNTSMNFDPLPLTASEQVIHDRAVTRSQKFHQASYALLESIEEVDRLRLFEKFALRSTMAYAIKYMNLTEDIAGCMIMVARKMRSSDVLKEALKTEELGISKARRICPVLTSENEAAWVEKAKELSKAKLEKEVAQVLPQPTVKPSIKPVGPNRTKLQFEASDEFVTRLRRAQDLESQRRSESAGLEETLLAALDSYLEARDPVRKADCAEKRKVHKPSPPAAPLPSRSPSPKSAPANMARAMQRSPIPAEVSHQVKRRDRGECQAPIPKGEKCRESRWTHLHHIVPVALGGENTAENLMTLCSWHHRQWHRLRDVSGTVEGVAKTSG